jgi:hypothetical protein
VVREESVPTFLQLKHPADDISPVVNKSRRRRVRDGLLQPKIDERNFFRNLQSASNANTPSDGVLILNPGGGPLEGLRNERG